MTDGSVAIGTASSGLTAGPYYLVTCTLSSGGAWAFYINGVAAGTGTNGTNFAAGRTTYLGGSGVVGEYMDGYIAEVCEADVVLTSGELSAVHADLMSYYGL